MDKKSEELFAKALAATRKKKSALGIPRTDWMSKDGKWTISGSGGTYRIDDRRNGITYMVKISMTGSRRWLMGARTTGPSISEPNLPRHVKNQLERMIATPPLDIGVHGVSRSTLGQVTTSGGQRREVIGDKLFSGKAWSLDRVTRPNGTGFYQLTEMAGFRTDYPVLYHTGEIAYDKPGKIPKRVRDWANRIIIKHAKSQT